MDGKAPKETYSYQAYRNYRDGFLSQSNMVNVMRQARKFYAGDQYEEGLDPNLPKPVMNICFKYVESVGAKLVGTPYAVTFSTDDDNRSLHDMDDFYSYQLAQMDDSEFVTDVVHTALIDGVACVFTAYDEDTYGYKGKYRGFLKRKLVPFEDCFFANPYCEDPQDQEYLGFVQRMPIRRVWDILERWGKKSLKKFIVDDSYDWDRDGYDETSIASKMCTVVTRYYRDEKGEVVFDLSTRYVDLFEAHHYLNPRKNERVLKSVKAEDAAKRFEDNEMAGEQSAVQTPPVRTDDSEYEEKLGRFWRYPFAMYRPYPVKGRILGNSVVTQLIPIQKEINFLMMMNAMSAQNHGMPKWAVVDGSLADGEEINNDPAQVLRIKLKPGQGAIGNVIQRIEPSAESGELLQLAANVETQAEQVFGFDNLSSDNMNDISGYAYQQVQKQKNLVLEVPQKRLWKYVKETARTDMLFYRHYVEEAKYYVHRDEGEMSLQNNMRSMVQSTAEATGNYVGADESGNYPEVPSTLERTIGTDSFMKNWEVAVEVTEGIAGSQIAESQHIQQVFASFNTGNVDASVMRAEIESDPAISRHNRQVILNSIKAMEVSQLAQKQAEIDQLKQVVTQMSQQLQYYGQQAEQAQKMVKSYQQASVQQAQYNKTLVQDAQAQAGMDMSEGEVKSNNSRGINGTTFGQYV